MTTQLAITRLRSRNGEDVSFKPSRMGFDIDIATIRYGQRECRALGALLPSGAKAWSKLSGHGEATDRPPHALARPPGDVRGGGERSAD